MVQNLYNVTCDEDNETFYAKDGKLYYREDDSVVSDILYFDHDFEKLRNSVFTLFYLWVSVPKAFVKRQGLLYLPFNKDILLG